MLTRGAGAGGAVARCDFLTMLLKGSASNCGLVNRALRGLEFVGRIVI